jgi:hypothetical protein
MQGSKNTQHLIEVLFLIIISNLNLSNFQASSIPSFHISFSKIAVLINSSDILIAWETNYAFYFCISAMIFNAG